MPYNLARYAKYPRKTESANPAGAESQSRIDTRTLPSTTLDSNETHIVTFKDDENIENRADATLPLSAEATSVPILGSSATDLPELESPSLSAISIPTSTRSSLSSTAMAKAISSTVPFSSASDISLSDLIIIESTPPSTSHELVIHCDPECEEPEDIYAPIIITSSPPLCQFEAAECGDIPTLGLAKDGLIPGLDAFPPPRPLKKPDEYISRSGYYQKEQGNLPPLLPCSRQQQPSMLLFQILGTKNNYKASRVEYIIRFKFSDDNPEFPNCPARDNIFLFDEVCQYKAIIDRIRLYHYMNPFKAKDIRVDDPKYKITHEELIELRNWHWPGYIGKEWAKCLIWPDREVETKEGK
ncbi:hypothetical protein H072_4482 [Dactylellina haptotyla CBS 200.50]|uniref:Uncharacterized protein n=1 Tax=Dactylellina haptotyla (strain CBS 200.50) TaxID=1284197 RepID=S8BQ90_DACHA|nr:hypothetical protein H072_4482 [Dactylellina haptotyla CBS 200.50]